MIVTIAGIKRSGSTAQFNMVRCLFHQAGIRYTQHGSRYNENDFRKHAIIKVHKFDDFLYNASDYIFTTDRPDNEILNSLNAFSGETTQERIDDMRLHLEKWNEKAHCFNYNSIVTDPKAMMVSLCELMDLGLTEAEIESAYDEFKSIKPPKKGYNKNTFLFHNHIRHC